MAEMKYLIDYDKLMEEWDWEKNVNLNPVSIASRSHKRAWWKCSIGHEWQTTVDHRNNGSECPFCSGKKVLRGYNDLQTVNPTLSKEWNYKKILG